MTLGLRGTESPDPTLSPSERGVALISVLWALVVLSLIAAAFTRSTRTNIDVAFNLGTGFQAMELADAGVYIALQGLIAKTETQAWRTDGAVYAWTYANSEIRVSISDEGGKVDLNAAPVELLTSLLRATELDEAQSVAVAEAVGDFRDTDDVARSSGAEDVEYRSANALLGPKNGPFTSIEELRQVLGVSSPLFDRIAPTLTVHSRLQRPHGANISPQVKAVLAGETIALPGGTLAASAYQANASPTLVDSMVDTRTKDRSPVSVYTIHSEAVSEDGASFAREAVVRVSGAPSRLFEILEWRRARKFLLAAP